MINNMKTKEFKIGDVVEHINKESKSGYPHDKEYVVYGFCRMKNPTTGEWVDGVQYSQTNNLKSEIFVREKEDFCKQFKVSEFVK